MSMATILLVEDEQAIRDTLVLNLELENYKVHTAKSGNEALSVFQKHTNSIQLILLDVMLPEINGFELIKAFKQEAPALPVIFITARNQSSDKISGLKLGADDYLTKPFDLEELLLRIQNLLKRTLTVLPNNQFSFVNGKINFDTFEITDLKGQLHLLSKREIGLLQLLTSTPNKVVSRDEIIEKLWNESENPSSRTIDNYILNFRKLFENNPKEPVHFHSVRGVGYKFTT
jgi:two-component system alkaline phosphatase synthesis response regulator PhoP